MPRMKTESFGTDDIRWQGSERGIHTARSGVLNPASFASVVKDGRIPSGVPLAEGANGLELYTGTGTFAGHLLTAQKLAGNEKLNVPVYDHGRVLTSLLPVAFTPPAEQTNTTIVYLEA